MKVLFSGFGKTDPARGERDGGMLHILRHYRPDAVMIFMTAEIAKLDAKDHRISKTQEFIRTHWDGYAPEFIPWRTDITDPSDMDAMDRPLRDAMQELRDRYPKAEVLVNLSSGTPQMKMILAQLTLELKDPTGIQVSSPEKASNKTDPTTAGNYPIDEELELTEEEESSPDAPNRCREPKLISIRRAGQRQQVEKLLERKDYRAVCDILSGQSILPREALAMAEHLTERYDLRSEKAKAAVRGINADFSLYPRKQGAFAESDYREVSEYFLMMKNFQLTGRYTDFVLRLTPLTVRLQERLLDRLLKREYGVALEALKGFNPIVNRKQLLVQRLREKVPALLNALNEQLEQDGKDPFRNSNSSVYVYNLMLRAVSALSPEEELIRALFWSIGKLTENRNQAAHSLTATLTNKDIRDCAGCSCGELEKQLEQAMIVLYPECDPSLFNIYRKCEKFILERL